MESIRENWDKDVKKINSASGAKKMFKISESFFFASSLKVMMGSLPPTHEFHVCLQLPFLP